MIETLNQHAAIAARDGVENGIRQIEARLAIKLDEKANAEWAAYFADMQAIDRLAIQQLKKFSAALNKRVFDAYEEERS